MGASVLIIDADEEFAGDVADHLRAHGVEASTTGDGKLGLDLARINLPSAIVLCVELPRMSGYSVCAKLKKDEALKSVPVVITSSEATPETFEQHRKLKSRAEDYLKKPVDSAVVVQVLGPYLGLGESLPEPAEAPQEDLQVPDLAEDQGAIEQVFDSLQAPAGAPEDLSAFADDSAEALTAVAEVDDVPIVEEPPSDAPPPLPPSGPAIPPAESSPPASASTPPAPSTPPPSASTPPEPAVEAAAPSTPPPPPPASVQFAESDDGDSKTRLGEYEGLKAQITELQAAKEEAERQRDLAVAAEQAAREASRHSQAPTGSHISHRDALALKKERNALERELTEQRVQWHAKEEELEGRIVELEEAVEATASEKAALETQAAGERAKLAESDRMHGQIRGQLNEATQRNTTLQQRVDGLERELNKISEQLNVAQAELTTRENESVDAAQRIEHLTQEVSRLSNELEATNAEATSLRDQVSSKTEEAATLSTQLNARGTALDEAQSQIGAVEAARSQVEGELVRAYQRIEDDGATRGKVHKALEIALALLNESEFEADESVDLVTQGDGASQDLRS